MKQNFFNLRTLKLEKKLTIHIQNCSTFTLCNYTDHEHTSEVIALFEVPFFNAKSCKKKVKNDTFITLSFLAGSILPTFFIRFRDVNRRNDYFGGIGQTIFFVEKKLIVVFFRVKFIGDYCHVAIILILNIIWGS